MSKRDRYAAAMREIDVRLQKGGDRIADLGNAAAVLKKRLGFFWVGFYFTEGSRLVLGPFQGTPACAFLPTGKGVCGTCAAKKETVIVPDVRKFPGYVACDPDSQSEIAVPVYDAEGRLRAVLDADSDRSDTFDADDREGLENTAILLSQCWNN